MKRFAWITVVSVLFLPVADAAEMKVPFVGCPADGQAGALAAPVGSARMIQVAGMPASALSYYKGEQGSGVFAPAGWHCRVWYGSSGGFIVVTPEVIKPPYFPPPAYAGPAVEMSTAIGGTSGRFEVARVGALLFPALTKKFVQEVERDEIALGREPERKSRYEADSLTYLSPRIVQFQTPANSCGLGSEGHIRPGSQPIQGLVVLQESAGDEPDISILRIHPGDADPNMVPLILKLNAECMSLAAGC